MLDCSLLNFQGQHYIIPTIAIAQAILLNEGIRGNSYTWQNMNIPILAFDLLPLTNRQLNHPKLAIMHGISRNPDLPIYFATVFEGRVRRVKITREEITWSNENHTQVMIKCKKEVISANLVDLLALTQMAIVSIEASQAQVAK